jgi:hypothetical protein
MDPGAVTVPNFLRTYTPSLVGGSLGHHLIEVNTAAKGDSDSSKLCDHSWSL